MGIYQWPPAIVFYDLGSRLGSFCWPTSSITKHQLLEILWRHWCLFTSLNAGPVAETHLFPATRLFTVLIDLQGEIIGYLTRKNSKLGDKNYRIFKLGGPMGTITSQSRTFDPHKWRVKQKSMWENNRGCD